MPIYEYQCDACGHKLEKLQKVSDEPLKDCPACSQAALHKLVSAAAFRLKGGGWYETDFKTGSKKNVSGGEAPAKGAGAEGTAASTDSKPSSDASGTKPAKSKPSDTSSASAAG